MMWPQEQQQLLSARWAMRHLAEDRVEMRLGCRVLSCGWVKG